MPIETEADTCRKYVLPKLYAAGWSDDQINEQRTFTDGRIVPIGDRVIRRAQKRADYLLRYSRDFALAVVEAKATYKKAGDGLQQAKEYAEILGLQFAYLSNGHEIVEHDFLTGRDNDLCAFPSRKFRRCQCPVWVDGFLGDQELRKSLRIKKWDKAQRIVREWEAHADDPPKTYPQPSLISIQHACDTLLNDAAARNLRESTLKKYRLLFRQLHSFAVGKGFRFIKELDLSALREFRMTWPNRNLGALKKLEYLRAFFSFAKDSDWIPDNPASKIKNPRVSHCPTMPYSHDEMIKILRACDEYGQKFQGERRAQENARRARALVLLLRYSGLRITDAVGLARNRITNEKLFLYTAKTGAPVYCPLPEVALAALDAVPRTSERYFFWTGDSKIESAVTNWQNALRDIFLWAGVTKGHAHRFRDTFAVELLLSRVPIERVSVLLGHASVRITEKHYAPWVRERQAQLEEDIQRSWERDPLLKGTPEVHEERRISN